MQVINNPPPDIWESLIHRPLKIQSDVIKVVKDILDDVRERGDLALIDYGKKFDGFSGSTLKVTLGETRPEISSELQNALQTAYHNIRKFHLSQKEETIWIETMPGVRCCRRSTPVEKVGLYIPGGSAPLFSTLLMLGIPAQIAGCKQVVVCTPPQADGSIHPALLYIGSLLGIKEFYSVGGAQAIAAMSFGTETIPKVYKILGPGNQYVTMAKQLVSPDYVAIDFPAGPSEVAILADDQANPEFIASDLLSQAEHGQDSQVILATDSYDIITQVRSAVKEQLKQLSRKEIATEALQYSKLILFPDLSEAMDFLNIYAPEHLMLNIENPDYWADKVTNAGSVFMGAFSPESAGDYASGTNHTLPTNGNAKMYAGVSLDTFVKKITFQEITSQGLNNLGSAIETMAEAEGLEAHKKAVSIRREFTAR